MHMDKASVELAQNMLVAHNEVWSPVYQQLREELYGKLSDPQLTLDSLKKRLETSKKNHEMLASVAAVLPSMEPVVDGDSHHYHFSVIRAEDIYEASMLQKRLIWTGNFFRNNRNRQPFYLMGDRTVDKKWTDLLLVPATIARPEGVKEIIGVQTLPIIERVRSKQFDEFKKRNALMPPDKDVVRRLLNFDTQELEIKVGSPESIKVGESGQLKTPNRLAESVKHDLTDQLLAQFKTFDYLDDIAVMFNITDHVHSIIAKQSETK